MAASKAIPLLFFLGFLSLTSSLVTAATKADYFKLWLMWPGPYCYRLSPYGCCVPTTGKPAEDFLVKGLLPYNSVTGKPVTNCNTTRCKFYVNALQKFIEDMFKYWSNLDCPSNNGVGHWKDTWCTYGICSGFNETTYFNNTLQLRANLDILSVLKSSGIVPSRTKWYNLEDIETALVVNYGFSTEVDCNRGSTLMPYEISSIYVCVAIDGKTVISCPSRKRSNCAAKVRFPPFPNLLSPQHHGDDANPIELPSAHDMAM